MTASGLLSGHARPLFDWAPVLQKNIPWQPLADLPTPLERLAFADNAWIKRDDITHAEYGGNKIRKLEFIVADAQARGARKIVTFGATGTNHGVATAMMCQRSGLECEVLLFNQPDSPTVQLNQALMRHYGASLVYCGGLATTVMRYYLHPGRFARGHYFLFAGGSSVAGTLGFVNAAFELKQQILQGVMPMPSVIICPVGSSATLAGLTLGCQWADLPVRVIGVRVAPSHLGPFPACTTGSVSQLMQATRRFLMKAGTPALPLPQVPLLLNDYYGSGYGEKTAAGEAAKARFAQHGVTLEQTYSAKAAACFMDFLGNTPGPVVFWQTFNSRPTPATL
jgi:D-cysteine desulfhydrase